VREGHRLMLLGAASDGAKPSAMLRLAYQLDDGRRGSVRVVQPRTPRLAVIHSPASAQTVATPLLSQTQPVPLSCRSGVCRTTLAGAAGR
jgi:hypothetical protein